MPNTLTTESLRERLFATIDDVRTGRISAAEAKAIANVSDQIIASAQLELEWARTTSALDKQEQGVSAGPLYLASNNSTESATEGVGAR